MGTTFVKIADRGFWMNDSVLELWLRLAALHIEDPYDGDPNDKIKREIRDQWLLASRGYFQGCVPDGINEAVSTSPGTEVVINAINELTNRLKQAPDYLNKDVLNILGLSPNDLVADFRTDRLLEVCESILGLIEGRLGGAASDTTFMPGTSIK